MQGQKPLGTSDLGDKFNAFKYAVKESIEATFGNSATPGSLDGIYDQLAGDTPQHMHAQELCRTAVNKVIATVDFKSEPAEQVKAMQAGVVQIKKELEDKTLKIQLKQGSTPVLPTIFNPQNTAICRMVGEVADKRVLLNKIYLNLPEEIASKAKIAMPLQGHGNDEDQLFVEIKSNGNDGKRAVYVTHQLKKEDPESSTKKILYLGNLPRREKTVAIPLQPQPLPPQLQKQLVPGQPAALPAQPGVVVNQGNLAGAAQLQPGQNNVVVANDQKPVPLPAAAPQPFPAFPQANLNPAPSPVFPGQPQPGFPPAGQ